MPHPQAVEKAIGFFRSPRLEPGAVRLSKKPSAFLDSLNNAVIFVPRSGMKIVASLHARLAEQGLARHLI